MGEEKRFEEKLKRYCRSRGIWYLKTYSDGVQRAGVPDLICCVAGRFVALELKSQKGRASVLQIHEIEKIKDAGGYAEVVRPDDYEKITDTLDRMIVKRAIKKEGR